MAKRNINTHNNNLMVGLLILIVGSVLLLQRLGMPFPDWLFSWPMLIIAIGVAILVKHQFRSVAGFFMLLIGTFFLLKRELMIGFLVGPYLIPIGLILLGLYLMIFKKNRKHEQWAGWENIRKEKGRDPFYTGNPDATLKGMENMEKPIGSKGTGSFHNDGGDVLNSQALFCGVQKRVLSKNFYGGKISTFFGGTEIDLSQADIPERAFLDVDVVFGAIKLVVPPHWDLKIDVANVFAGIEDKRLYAPASADPAKVMVIRGTVIFGGLEIKSF